MYFKAESLSESSENRIWNEVDQITHILEDLHLNKDKITALELSSNSIGSKVAVNLSEKINNLKNLQYANFSDIFVTRKLDEIPETLKNLISSIENKRIRILNLSDNAFGPVGIKQLQSFLKTAKHLKELYIENCGLGPEGSELLFNSLKENPNIKNLEFLKVSRNRLENKGAKALSELLGKLNSLERLEISQNGINSEGFEVLFDSLKDNTKLRYLDLEDNVIGESGQNLINVLPLLKNLETLKISDCIVGGENGVKIFEILQKMKEIEFNFNDLDEKKSQKKIFEICQDSEKMKNLKKVEIYGNDIDKKLWEKYKKDLEKKIDNFVVYSNEELEADDYSETSEDEFGNPRDKKKK